VPTPESARNKNHRQADRRGFGDGADARSAHDEVGSSHQGRHAVSERHPRVARALVLLHAEGTLLPGYVNHLFKSSAELFERGPHRLVQVARPLAAAGDEETARRDLWHTWFEPVAKRNPG